MYRACKQETIKEMFYYYLRNPEIVKIRQRDIAWKNHYIIKFLGNTARPLSKVARNLCMKMVEEKVKTSITSASCSLTSSLTDIHKVFLSDL